MKHKTTEQVIAEMLTENTGTHFLDSGGIGGRHWQRNQGRDFESEPATYLSFKYAYIEYTLNLYHFLKETLSYSPEWQRRFDWYVRRTDPNDDKNWHELKNEFAEINKSSKFGNEVENWGITNSYNYDNFLSQDIEFASFAANGKQLVILQTHNGCDARGGYSAPKLFLGGFEDYPSIYDFDKGTIYCENTGKTLGDLNQPFLFEGMEHEEIYHLWDFDGGSWVPVESWQNENAKSLESLNDYEIVQEDDDEEERTCGTPNTSIILVDDEGNGYCPGCGGKLTA